MNYGTTLYEVPRNEIFILPGPSMKYRYALFEFIVQTPN